MNNNHRWGLFAEYLVMFRYFICGYVLVKHRWKSKLGEIDLIFKRGSSIVFCEVKARSSNFKVDYHVSKDQKIRLTKSADYFVSVNKKINIKCVRCDLAIVKSFFNIEIITNWISH